MSARHLLLPLLALACAACAGRAGRAGCAACAAPSPPAGAANVIATPIDVDRSCLSARWQRGDDGHAATVSADNGCGRPLRCDVHLTLKTAAGPDLYLECRDRPLPPGRNEALCRWSGEPVAPGGSGRMRCR